MSDQTNINQPNSQGGSQGNIMKELSDIKSSLAVNTSETSNIKSSIVEIKTDIRDIKTKYINIEQHKVLQDVTCDHETRIRKNETNITRIMTIGSMIIVLMGIAEFLISHFYH